MKTPKIKITNDSPDENGLRVVIFQTAPHSGWKKATAWRVAGIPKGGFAEMEIPEDYAIALEYIRDEVTLETEQLPLANGTGAFEINGSAHGLELIRMDDNPASRRLEVEAKTNFEGYVELLIFKGSERVFPKTQLGPGWSTSPQLNGPYYVGLFPHGKAGVDFYGDFAAPKVEVTAWDEVQITGSKLKGYSLKVVEKFKEA